MIGSPRAALAAVWIVVCLVSFSRPAAAQSLPSPWTNADVGSPVLAGAASSSSGTFTIDAAGEDIWDTQDQFHFVYQTVTGDFDLRARVDSLNQAHWWSKAGVMVRNSLSAGAVHGFAMVSGESGTGFQRRLAANGISLHSPGVFLTAPHWVRLTRTRGSLSAYTSTDGATWSLIRTQAISLAETVYVGMAVSSHEAMMRASATFSSVTLMRTDIPAGETGADIGAPAISGSVRHAAGTYTITAAGQDIWERSDQFHYLYRPMTGDVDVRARVDSLDATDGWAKTGIMIRETLSPGSRHAFAALTPENGYVLQHRTDPDGWSDSMSGGWGTAPGWLRLTRHGTRFEAFRSTDGASWISMGAVAVEMTAAVLVGVAVTSHNESTATVAVIDNLQIGSPTSPTEPPPPTTGVPDPPRAIAFTVSADHDTMVSRYVLEVFADTAAPGTTAPVSSHDLGMPAPNVAGEVTVDCSAFFAALPPGNYQATITAVGSSGNARSAPVGFSR